MLRASLVCLACLLLGVNGCTGGRSEVLSVIVCAGDAKGIVDLKDLLRGVAAQEGFEFHDGSENARIDLEALERSHPDVAEMRRRSSREPIITVEMIHPDGRTVSVTNAALPGGDVFLAIQGRRQDANVRVFARELVATLSKAWTLYDVTEGHSGPALGLCE